MKHTMMTRRGFVAAGATALVTTGCGTGPGGLPDDSGSSDGELGGTDDAAAETGLGTAADTAVDETGDDPSWTVDDVALVFVVRPAA